VTEPVTDNPFDQLTLEQLRARRSLKWRAYPPDVLPLWVAEMDTTLAAPVVEAVHRALAVGDSGYPYGAEYAEALAAFAAKRWGWRPDPEPVRLVADVMNGIVEVLKLVTGPGDAVVLTPPVYPPFFAFVTHLDREVVTAPLGADDRLDPAALEQAFQTATGSGRRAALLLANPHNPTGTVHTAAELESVAALANRYGVRVLVDEIHGPLAYGDAPFTPYLSVAGGDRGFSILSASKGWNLAGLKAAVVVPGERSADDLARMPEEVGHGASALGVLAHTVALQAGEEWLDQHLVGLDHNRVLLADLCPRLLPSVSYRLPQASYLAWLDCRALGLGDDPAAVFLERGRVALSAGPAFGPGGPGHVRLNFATAPAIVTEAIERMASCVP
jgi:cystathionine beta-lyase